MIDSLVVNGCSYMDLYSSGLGHVDLANRLMISKAHSIAKGGSANSRIIRTTLKHSYQVTEPTLYVIGLTFFSRWELPVNNQPNDFEGRWINPQAHKFKSWAGHWTDGDTEHYKELSFKAYALSRFDQLEDLMYRCLALLTDLRSRGHQAVIYNQIESKLDEELADSRLAQFKNDESFVAGLNWASIGWQHSLGVKKVASFDGSPPNEYSHPAAGEHHFLNTFLSNYITSRNIHNISQ